MEIWKDVSSTRFLRKRRTTAAPRYTPLLPCCLLRTRQPLLGLKQAVLVSQQNGTSCIVVSDRFARCCFGTAST